MSREIAPTNGILNQFNLTGKVAMVTGASRGIGQALAMALAEAGADLVLVARTKDALDRTASCVDALGRGALAVPADISRVSAIQQVVDAAIDRFGRIDILVNAAGTQARKPIVDVAEDDWEKVNSLNVKAVYFVSQAVARHMIGRGKGKIVNICSLTSSIGIRNTSVYGAAKGGVLALTRAMSTEWSGQGINVNGIAPGYFKTEMTRPLYEDPQRNQWVLDRTPMGRWGDVSELKGVVVFLASAASDFLTGQMINMDGGWLAS
jgi:2-deoxy-D-gluconate 3-dehydrogenase